MECFGALATGLTPPDRIDPRLVDEKFEEYQAVWNELGLRWLEYRRTEAAS
ncbi:hypothetical protein [Amycolatopsis speibonae]|uniref:Uncharacterized protein n=1 Tax=Amycolatopsis speibonae TaxID=1450224 RepID=A0ABV7NZA0_9PSEU